MTTPMIGCGGFTTSPGGWMTTPKIGFFGGFSTMPMTGCFTTTPIGRWGDAPGGGSAAAPIVAGAAKARIEERVDMESLLTGLGRPIRPLVEPTRGKVQTKT